MEAVAEIGDPFHTAQALLVLLDVYKKTENPEREGEILKRIVSLPDREKRFISLANLAIAYQKSGLLDDAKQAYLALQGFGAGEDPGFQANLAELLLLRGELREAAPLIEKLLSRPEPRYVVIGRLMKALCLFLEGRGPGAEEEIKWLGQYLLSMSGMPPDLAWDFRDSAQLLDKMKWPEARLVLQMLTKRLGFDQFRDAWLRLHPVPPPAGTSL